MVSSLKIKLNREPAATNARVEDEAVETILRMNQKHILLEDEAVETILGMNQKTHPPLPKVIDFFSFFSTPKSFPPTLPPSHQPPPSSPLQPPSLPQPTSHDFALTPPLKLGSYWSMNKAREQLEREHSHNNMLEASP
jgi:hypothetical protein